MQTTTDTLVDVFEKVASGVRAPKPIGLAMAEATLDLDDGDKRAAYATIEAVMIADKGMLDFALGGVEAIKLADHALDIAYDLQTAKGGDPQAREVAAAEALRAETKELVERIGRIDRDEPTAAEIVAHLIARNENGFAGSPEPYELRSMLAALASAVEGL